MNKYIIGGVLLALVAAFAAGRYLTPTKVETKIVTVEVEKKHEETKTKTTTVKKPDGTTTTTTESDTKVDTNTTTNSKSDTIVEHKVGTLNISALAGADVTIPRLVYGLSVTKSIIGPVTIGLWGLSNKTVGGSIGFQF